MAKGLEYLDSAPSFADTAVQDTEAVDSADVPSATPIPSNMIAARHVSQRSCSSRRQVAESRGLLGRGEVGWPGVSPCGEKDGRFTGEIILPVDFLATLSVTGRSPTDSLFRSPPRASLAPGSVRYTGSAWRKHGP